MAGEPLAPCSEVQCNAESCTVYEVQCSGMNSTDFNKKQFVGYDCGAYMTDTSKLSSFTMATCGRGLCVIMWVVCSMEEGINPTWFSFSRNDCVLRVCTRVPTISDAERDLDMEFEL